MGGGGATPTTAGFSGSSGVSGRGELGGAAGDSGASGAGRTSSTAGIDGGEGGDDGLGGTQSVPAGAAGTAGTGGMNECSRTGAPCFEPCGGDPFGNWIVEAGCLAGGELGEGCVGGSIAGTLGELSLRLSFEAEGLLRVSGREAWELSASAPRACLNLDGAEPCDQGVLFTSPLLFAQSRSVLGCQLEACGSCECSGAVDGRNGPGSYRWVTSGTRLALDASSFLSPDLNVSYCVDGDVMYLGGDDTNGQSTVAYKLRKQSCVQTMPPCEVRPFEVCEATQDCRWGACLRALGSQAFCDGWADFQCEEMSDCVWDPNRCSATGAPSCDFHDCERMPGCELGPPVARCVGSPTCSGFSADECNEPGCSVRSCRALGDDVTDCVSLNTSCALAPGCTYDGVTCQGTTRCSEQTNDEACSLLPCEPVVNCWGFPPRKCSELPVDECLTLPGCRVEW
jgi:hypothetical protein